MKRRRNLLLCVLALAAWRATALRSDETTPQPTKGPQYNDQGELKRPTDYRTWVFVGSNLGLQYRQDTPKPREADRAQPARPGNFHNVYINPEAYEHYLKTGKFPDPTVLVMDVYEARERDAKDIVAKGLFPGKQLRIEVAVKNSKRPDGSATAWAYYDFPNGQPTARAFPDKACYQCHLQHADDDNVWVQFYPILRQREKAPK
jgi:hypothetical protein